MKEVSQTQVCRIIKRVTEGCKKQKQCHTETGNDKLLQLKFQQKKRKKLKKSIRYSSLAHKVIDGYYAWSIFHIAYLFMNVFLNKFSLLCCCLTIAYLPQIFRCIWVQHFYQCANIMPMLFIFKSNKSPQECLTIHNSFVSMDIL